VLAYLPATMARPAVTLRGRAGVRPQSGHMGTCESCRKFRACVKVWFRKRPTPDFRVCVDCAKDLNP
jgi:hypothetical protein